LGAIWALRSESGSNPTERFTDGELRATSSGNERADRADQDEEHEPHRHRSRLENERQSNPESTAAHRFFDEP
jgi:hypothetical protein